MSIYLNQIAQRVQDGTMQSGVDLCKSCRYAIIRKGSNSGFAEVRCGNLAYEPVVREPLAHCSRYLERGKLALHEMADIAYLLEKNKGVIGFLSPEDLRKQNSGATSPAPRIGF